MRTGTTAPSTVHLSAMALGGLLPACAVGAAGLLASVALAGISGLVGSSVAVGVVLGSGLLTVGAVRLTRDAPPLATMGLVLMSYATKVVIMATLFEGLAGTATVSSTALALTALVTLTAWTAGVVRAYCRLRVPVPDLAVAR